MVLIVVDAGSVLLEFGRWRRKILSEYKGPAVPESVLCALSSIVHFEECPAHADPHKTFGWVNVSTQLGTFPRKTEDISMLQSAGDAIRNDEKSIATRDQLSVMD